MHGVDEFRRLLAKPCRLYPLKDCWDTIGNAALYLSLILLTILLFSDQLSSLMASHPDKCCLIPLLTGTARADVQELFFGGGSEQLSSCLAIPLIPSFGINITRSLRTSRISLKTSSNHLTRDKHWCSSLVILAASNTSSPVSIGTWAPCLLARPSRIFVSFFLTLWSMPGERSTNSMACNL